MFTLVIGGSASGKSEYAEHLVLTQTGSRIYIATLYPWDQECVARIEKHRRARRDRGFETVERYTDLAGLELPPDSNVLLEGLGSLLSNELYTPQGGGLEAVLRGVETLERCDHLTVVAEEVCAGGADYAGDTLRYLEAMAGLNRALAQRADRVVEVVCGLPNVLKG